MQFDTIQSQTIYQGRAFDVRVDRVRLPNGGVTQLEIVEHPGAVVLVPLDKEGNLWFVRQYRHAARTSLLELPAGTMESEEDAETSAQREIREEIGVSAGNLKKIGEFYIAPGYSTEILYIYLATDLRPDPLPGDEDEYLSVEKFPIGQVFAMVEQGQIHDAKTLAALLLARPYLP